MKKLGLIIFIAAMCICRGNIRSQVFGYPGATWVFHNIPVWAVCFDTREKWEYVGDTVVDGRVAKDIFLTRKWYTLSTTYQEFNYHYYFDVSGDSVSVFLPSDTTWQLLYDFSLQTGDTTHSPLLNIAPFWMNCDSSIYYAPAIVSSTGTTNVDGQLLRYYTVDYLADPDSNIAQQTYYERIISFDYLYPYDIYFCGLLNECTPLSLTCYKDNGMMTDSICNDLSWFETLSLNDADEVDLNMYPNPATDVLMVEDKSQGSKFYDILSIQGKVVISHVQSPINLYALPSGIYFLTNGDRSVYRKFIKT